MRLEDPSDLLRREAVVLVQRHPVDEPHAPEEVHDPVDRRLGHRDHEPATWSEVSRHGRAGVRIRALGQMFDDGKHRDHVEPLVRYVCGEPSPHDPHVRAWRGRCRIGIDPDAAADPATEPLEERAVGAAHIEHA